MSRNNAVLDSSNKPMGRRLAKHQFDRLIELIRPKFPDIEFPLRN